MTIELTELKDILVPAARDELLTRFNRVKPGIKADGSLITEADLAMQQHMADALQQKWPDIPFLAEEMTAGEQSDLLKKNARVWCLDPLDGTRNFAAGIPYFSVSLALIEGDHVAAGLVYDPTRDECFMAARGKGATLNGKALTARDTGLSLNQTTSLIDFKRLPQELSVRLVSQTPYSSQRSFGSVALDWCWIAAGRSHIYLHGKQNIWDYAAGNLVLHEAGGQSCTLSGEPVFINELIPRSALGALDARLYEEWKSWLGVA